jgi:hypothetical protein
MGGVWSTKSSEAYYVPAEVGWDLSTNVPQGQTDAGEDTKRDQHAIKVRKCISTFVEHICPMPARTKNLSTC